VSAGVIYLCLLVFGLGYALVAGFLGWLGDLGGGDVHVDASGHLDAGHIHPISGTTVATFITGFGGGGAVAHYLFDWPLLGELCMAVGTGVAMGGAAFGVLELIFKQTQAGGEFEMATLAGREAEVITAIPAGGTGEIAYHVKGQREVSPARSVDDEAIGKGRLVIIDRTGGSTIYVRKRERAAER
jgi:hypothetical protein